MGWWCAGAVRDEIGWGVLRGLKLVSVETCKWEAGIVTLKDRVVWLVVYL